MQTINKYLEHIRNLVKAALNQVAKALNTVTGGKLNPNAVTIFGCAMHIPIALLIARGYFLYAALALVFFGLFDTLDGALARLQNRPTRLGMLLDSVTDRIKEALLYIGVAYFFVWSGQAFWAVWAVAACGAGLLVSYINAWGDVVTADLKTTNETNKAFRGGLMSFDVRMFSLVIGLALNLLTPAIVVITVLSWFTAFDRLKRISHYVRHVKS